MHLIDIVWRKASDGFIPQLLYRNGDDLESLSLIPGTTIRWHVRGPRRCIGYRDQSTGWIPCPEQNETNTSPQCRGCSEIDSLNPCVRCNGTSCKAAPSKYASRREKEYVLYLAYFSNDMLKVGVSSLGRVTVRWVEQGADFCAILANVTGCDTARRMESQLGSYPNVRMAMSVESKAKAISSGVALEDVERRIMDFLGRIKCPECIKKPDIVDLRSFYHLDNLTAHPTLWPSKSMPNENQGIAGTILGMKGDILVTYIGNAYTSIALKRLIGYNIVTGSNEVISTQLSLLDFV